MTNARVFAIAPEIDVGGKQPPALGNKLDVILMKRLHWEEAFGGSKIRTTEKEAHSIGGRPEGVGYRQQTRREITKPFPFNVRKHGGLGVGVLFYRRQDRHDGHRYSLLCKKRRSVPLNW